jgi:hypothetical protein
MKIGCLSILMYFFSEDNDSDEDEKEDEVRHEGFLIKISSNKSLLKRWFKLVHRDFYCKY